MRFIDYLKDKFFPLIVSFTSAILIVLILLSFNVNKNLIILISIIYIISFVIVILYEYFRKRKFYYELNTSLKNLNKKYYINEIIKDTNFLEGKILLEYLYDINKSYIENINKYKYINEEFKEYIELWCHEIKTPISTSKLIIDNNKNNVTNSILEEIENIEYFVEQVLYYSRSENVEKDYIIKKLKIKEVINDVIKNNKKELLSKKIKVEIEINDELVESDPKWITYIINQIIINSIKYSKNKDSFIKISIQDNKNNLILYIEDNGIGIKEEEIEKVFDKGFTGTNGRKFHSSTGIGLYLVKKLCDKLGHNISVSSKENKGTTVTIVFPNSSMYK